MVRPAFHCQPTRRSSFVSTIELGDTNRRKMAEIGSETLLAKMLRYGANNGGLPNLSASECREKLWGMER